MTGLDIEPSDVVRLCDFGPDSVEVEVMKDPKKSVGRGNRRSMILPVCIGITIMLLAATVGYGQGPKSDVALDDFDKAAVRELQTIAAAASAMLNVYMDARVTDMLVCSKVKWTPQRRSYHA